MKRVKWTIIPFLILVISYPALAGRGKISGLVYSDYYYFFSNHQKALEGMNGFWFRRIYFTYDYRLNKSFSLRIRTEAASSGNFLSEKITPFIKDMYLRWNFSGQSLYAGISPTPSFNMVEKAWGYRSVEKTPLDLYKMASSRDTGIALKGKFLHGKFFYHLMLANGEGNKSEDKREKKIYAALGLSPVKGLYIEVYGDYAKGSVPEGDITTLQGFFSYSFSRGALGFLYAKQSYGDGTYIRVASGFVRFNLSRKLTFLARADRVMDPIPDAYRIAYLPMDNTTPFSLFLAGLDLKITGNISLIPNLEMVNYDGGSDKDLIGKLTLYYKW